MWIAAIIGTGMFSVAALIAAICSADHEMDGRWPDARKMHRYTFGAVVAQYCAIALAYVAGGM